MEKEGNMITDWLKKYGDEKINKQVEKEIEIINKKEMIKIKIKEYCKLHKLKFKKYYKSGFIASSTIEVKAGMKKVLGTDKFEHYDLKVIRKDEILRHYLCYSNLDIVDNGIFNVNE